jgi:hypothetical protein
MQDYITKVIVLITQIQACGGIVSDVNYTGYLLRGLPKDYKTVKVICNSKRGEVKAVKTELLGKEARQKGERLAAQPTPPLGHVLSANRFPRKGKGNQGSKSKDKSKEKCRRCQKLGHYAYECRAEKPVNKGSENTQNVKGHYGNVSPKLAFIARRPEY